MRARVYGIYVVRGALFTPACDLCPYWYCSTAPTSMMTITRMLGIAVSYCTNLLHAFPWCWSMIDETKHGSSLFELSRKSCSKQTPC